MHTRKLNIVIITVDVVVVVVVDGRIVHWMKLAFLFYNNHSYF